MKTMNLSAAMFVVALLVISSSSNAAVWRVEKDGSGDFMVIQDAVDAAADGDTLMIGPGRFDDYRRYDFPYWTNRIIHILLDGRSLTMIGSGEGMTVIGPTMEFPQTEHDKGIVLLHGAELHVSGLTLERHDTALECWDDSYFEVEHCTFQNHTWGVGCGIFSSRGARITNCSFLNHDTGIYPGSGSADVIVDRCVFREVIYGMNTTSTHDLIVRDTSIEAVALGIQLWSSSTASLSNVDIVCDNTALIVKAGSVADLSNCNLLGDSLTAVWVDGLSSLTGTCNILRGNDCPSLRIYRSDVALSDSHILSSSGYAVECEPNFPADWTLDLRNNWWGVSDADSVASLIYDGNDSPDIDILVDYLPYRDGQVSNESMGWGELKRLFR